MLHFSGAVVALRRALKIAKEFASSAGSRVLESRKLPLKSASGSVPREAATFAVASFARGNALFRGMKMPVDRKSMSDRLSNTPGKRDRLSVFPIFPPRRQAAFPAKPRRAARSRGRKRPCVVSAKGLEESTDGKEREGDRRSKRGGERSAR